MQNNYNTLKRAKVWHSLNIIYKKVVALNKFTIFELKYDRKIQTHLVFVRQKLLWSDQSFTKIIFEICNNKKLCFSSVLPAISFSLKVLIHFNSYCKILSLNLMVNVITCFLT